MACNKCKTSKCSCGKKRIKIFDDRPEVIKTQSVPVPGPQGTPGDVYVPVIDDNFFAI